MLDQQCDEILALDVIREGFFTASSIAEALLTTNRIIFSRLFAINSGLIVLIKFITFIKIASRAEKPPWSDWQSLARVGVATLSRINIINHSLLSYIYGALFGLLYFNLYFRFLPVPWVDSLMPTKNTNNTLWADQNKPECVHPFIVPETDKKAIAAEEDEERKLHGEKKTWL